jgi:hypothetical protein
VSGISVAAELHNLATRKNVGKAEGLLHSLVPRAQCFCFYDLSRTCVWSSDSVEDYEIDNFVADLPDEVVAQMEKGDDVLRRTLSSGRTVLAFPVRGEGGRRLGNLVVLFSKNAGKSASFIGSEILSFYSLRTPGSRHLSTPAC